MKKYGLFSLLVFIPWALSACITPIQDIANLEERTLDSLTRVDDHPLYVMHYYGPYITDSPERDLLPEGQNPSLAWACSLFAALGDQDAMLYGRNFDWELSPAVLLFTDPPDAYASVSMVDIAYLGFSASEARRLDKLSLEKRRLLLQAPFLPFDGMNEHGLVIGMAAVPKSTMPHDAGKATLGSLGIIREMLDHAKTVEEAIALMARYTIDMTGGPSIHYLIADATGQAALVEFYQGAMHVTYTEMPWHQATNFLRVAVDDPAGTCARYDTIYTTLESAQGVLTVPEALDLLVAVSQDSTQWSVVYSINARSIHIVMGRAYQKVYPFKMSNASE